LRRPGWVVLLAWAAAGCSIQESPLGDSSMGEPSDRAVPTDNNAFGNVQPHHVREARYHAALAAYGPHALFVCNASLDHSGLLDDLRAVVGPDATLLANDPATFVPLWGETSAFWNDYRAAMDPANAGLPDSAWYWLDENGARRRAPRPCRGGGWCGEYWPGWALKPEPSAYRAKAEFLAERLPGFDGLFLDEWHAGFSHYQLDGLGIPREEVRAWAARWARCREIYREILRDRFGPGFVLVPNLQSAAGAIYSPAELQAFDGHTTEFPGVVDLSRFSRHPSPLNVGWTGVQSAHGLVRKGYGLPANVDP